MPLPHALLTFIAEGENFVAFGDSEYPLRAGDALLIPARTQFSALWHGAPASVINITLVARGDATPLHEAVPALVPALALAANDTAALRVAMEGCARLRATEPHSPKSS